MALAAFRPELLHARDASPSVDVLAQRIADLIEVYDAQGNHRSATAADNVSAEWLANCVRELGVEPALEPFALSRVDPKTCHLRIAGRRIEGVPLFDATFTDRYGVRGSLGPLGSDAEIGLAETESSRLTEPGSEGRRARLSEVRQARHKAVVLVTRGARPGLFLLNAPAFKAPFGPPTLQVSSGEADWLKAQAERRVEATLVAHVERVPAEALNITGRLAGRDRNLAPLVVSTPRSAWWQCTSERGGGIACWLEAMRTLAAAKPARDCLFVAFSGHEIGWLGIEDFLKRRPDLPKGAHAWIHFGANIGAPRQPNLVQASDDGIEQLVVATMEREGLNVDHKAARDATPFGEAAYVKRGGGRYAALVCDNDVFHNVADRWPDAVDVAMVARYAKAFANCALDLAQKTV
jgi:hypothetical protein